MEQDQRDAQSDAQIMSMTDVFRPNRKGDEEEDLTD